MRNIYGPDVEMSSAEHIGEEVVPGRTPSDEGGELGLLGCDEILDDPAFILELWSAGVLDLEDDRGGVRLRANEGVATAIGLTDREALRVRVQVRNERLRELLESFVGEGFIMVASHTWGC